MSDLMQRFSYFGQITKVNGGSSTDPETSVDVTNLTYDAVAHQTTDIINAYGLKPLDRPMNVTQRIPARVGDTCIIQVCSKTDCDGRSGINLIAPTERDDFGACT